MKYSIHYSILYSINFWQYICSRYWYK